MVRRPLTMRERAVLDALLSADFDGVEDLRRQANTSVVVGECVCGCPSIDFHKERGVSMQVRVNAAVEGSYDGLFLCTVGDRLDGIEWVSASDRRDPTEFPDPEVLAVRPV
ncbi:MAG: hypothetical protein J2P28_21285 [Actinobacteria bacterium]|nr:hypothetical protein [Actinomycetota bacterium]